MTTIIRHFLQRTFFYQRVEAERQLNQENEINSSINP